MFHPACPARSVTAPGDLAVLLVGHADLALPAQEGPGVIASHLEDIVTVSHLEDIETVTAGEEGTVQDIVVLAVMIVETGLPSV